MLTFTHAIHRRQSLVMMFYLIHFIWRVYHLFVICTYIIIYIPKVYAKIMMTHLLANDCESVDWRVRGCGAPTALRFASICVVSQSRGELRRSIVVEGGDNSADQRKWAAIGAFCGQGERTLHHLRTIFSPLPHYLNIFIWAKHHNISQAVDWPSHFVE